MELRRLFRPSRLSLASSLAFCGFLSLGAPMALRAENSLEERKLPMVFRFELGDHACQHDCVSWVSAVGIIDGDTPQKFLEFSKLHDLTSATIVLDSSGGSVNDAIALGHTFRELNASTRVGITVADENGNKWIDPEGYCESMCVFLFLSGSDRYIPPQAHMRIHQIWLGDRADNPKEAAYTAEDLMVVERDLGRLAKYTVDMGGNGTLLSISLNTPTWDPLHEMTPQEILGTNLATSGPPGKGKSDRAAIASHLAATAGKAVQDRFTSADSAPPASDPALFGARPTKAVTEAVADAAAGQH